MALYLQKLSVSDATILIKDMAGDAASNVANRVRPSPDDLAQMDSPAEDNVWHDTPDLSKDNVKKQLQSAYRGSPKEDAQAAAESRHLDCASRRIK